MNSWTLEPFGNLADFKNGLNFRAGETGHKLKVLGVGDFKERTKLEQVAGISSIHTKKKIDKSYLLQDGDLVFVRSNGNPALVGRCMQIFTNNEDISFSGFTIRARLKTDKTTPEFISLIMQGGLLKNILKRDGRGTNISNLNQDILSKLQIPIPSKSEQMDLLNLFGCWDNAIEKTEALIAAKERQFKWLTQFLISTKCPSWKHHLARELFSGVSSKGHPDEKLLSVTQEQGVVPRSMLSGRVMSPAGSTAGYKLVEKGNFVISLRSFQGGLEYSDYRGIVSPAYTVLSSKKEIHYGFYRHFFKSYIFIEKYLSVAVIGIRDGKQISSKDFDTIKIPYPDMEEQMKIASKLDEARQEIDLLKDILEKYRSQKRGLMQKLLTGKWQVNSTQPVAEGTLQELKKEVSA